MKFKVGDKVKLLECFDGIFTQEDYFTKIYTVTRLAPNTKYGNKQVVAIHLEPDDFWAEEHELRHLTPLEELL